MSTFDADLLQVGAQELRHLVGTHTLRAEDLNESKKENVFNFRWENYENTAGFLRRFFYYLTE